MKVVQVETVEWEKDHPTGALAFKYLLSGDDASPDNFVLLLARQDKHFATERHRHNFDQFRFPIRGDMDVGDGVRLREGQLGYFTEGAPYGPQNDPLEPSKPGERTHLTLQFGGATGYGYLGPKRLRACRDELRREGEFEDVFYRRHDGKTQNGLDAVWQHAFGSKLEYPKPRYPGPIIMDPKSFRWIPNVDAPGVDGRHLGTFTERGVWAEILRLRPGTSLTPHRADARRLLFVLSGSGTVDGTEITHHSAIQLDAGEDGHVVCNDTLELLVFGLPAITTNEIATRLDAMTQPA
ncbi:MAG: hypothetical protein AB1490_29900 [Pseudomonadota bacterium]